MKPFSLNKTQYNLVSKLYNGNLYALTLTRLNEINQIGDLVERWPEVFTSERLGFREVSLKVKDLGPLLDLLKYNSKHNNNDVYGGKIN